VDHPATSSANKLQTFAKVWSDTSACQAIMRDAANCGDDLHTLGKIDHLRELHGGLKIGSA